jgi:hypothetical protein
MPSLAVRNCNPGNIRDGEFARVQAGYVGPGEKGFARFGSWQAGTIALLKLLMSNSYRDLPLKEIISRYAPPVENDTQAYLNSVCTRTGLLPTDKITTPKALLEVAAAICKMEGWTV